MQKDKNYESDKELTTPREYSMTDYRITIRTKTETGYQLPNLQAIYDLGKVNKVFRRFRRGPQETIMLNWHNLSYVLHKLSANQVSAVYYYYYYSICD